MPYCLNVSFFNILFQLKCVSDSITSVDNTFWMASSEKELSKSCLCIIEISNKFKSVVRCFCYLKLLPMCYWASSDKRERNGEKERDGERAREMEMRKRWRERETKRERGRVRENELGGAGGRVVESAPQGQSLRSSSGPQSHSCGCFDARGCQRHSYSIKKVDRNRVAPTQPQSDPQGTHTHGLWRPGEAFCLSVCLHTLSLSLPGACVIALVWVIRVIWCQWALELLRYVSTRQLPLHWTRSTACYRRSTHSNITTRGKKQPTSASVLPLQPELYFMKASEIDFLV